MHNTERSIPELLFISSENMSISF